MPNDVEIAGQLDLLSKKISEGITGANDVLEQVESGGYAGFALGAKSLAVHESA